MDRPRLGTNMRAEVRASQCQSSKWYAGVCGRHGISWTAPQNTDEHKDPSSAQRLDQPL
jgi:hypothetical protein